MENREDFLEKLQNAEMVLVGLGEEFDCIASLKNQEEYRQKSASLKNGGSSWLLPALNSTYGREIYGQVKDSLQKLAVLLEKKNYFVIATSVNDVIREVSWKDGRLVMPCGGGYFKQCAAGCGGVLEKLSREEQERLRTYLHGSDAAGLEQKHQNRELTGTEDTVPDLLGVCPNCGGKMVLNNIYCARYDEKGYLDEWALYMKWLQGTLNRRLLVLELGVTMKYPSVIRWPFEKAVFFNQKAFMYRVNEKLYQLTEELQGKGMGISKNAIDWLQIIC